MKHVTFTVEINDDGDAILRLPEGRGQQADAASVAKLTEDLAAKLGKVKERHIGGHHHHHHGDNHHHHHQTN